MKTQTSDAYKYESCGKELTRVEKINDNEFCDECLPNHVIGTDMSDQERLSHLVEALWFYDGMPFVGGKIQMDIGDAQFLTRLAQEAIIAR